MALASYSVSPVFVTGGYHSSLSSSGNAPEISELIRGGEGRWTPRLIAKRSSPIHCRQSEADDGGRGAPLECLSFFVKPPRKEQTRGWLFSLITGYETWYYFYQRPLSPLNSSVERSNREINIISVTYQVPFVQLEASQLTDFKELVLRS